MQAEVLSFNIETKIYQRFEVVLGSTAVEGVSINPLAVERTSSGIIPKLVIMNLGCTRGSLDIILCISSSELVTPVKTRQPSTPAELAIKMSVSKRSPIIIIRDLSGQSLSFCIRSTTQGLGFPMTRGSDLSILSLSPWSESCLVDEFSWSSYPKVYLILATMAPAPGILLSLTIS